MVSLASSHGALSLPSFPLPSPPVPASLLTRSTFPQPRPVPSDSHSTAGWEASGHDHGPGSWPAGPARGAPLPRTFHEVSIRIWPLKTSSYQPPSLPIRGGGKATHHQRSVPGGVGVPSYQLITFQTFPPSGGGVAREESAALNLLVSP